MNLNKKTPNVIVYSDYPNSSCSFWRSHGVLSYLSRDGHINFIEGTWNDTWTTLQFADIAFFQRPMMATCFDQIAMAKDCGLKIIIDLDDYNYIPETHPVYPEYAEGYGETEFIKIMMLADLVITTNEYLKKHYSKYNKNVKIVSNSLNDHMFKISPFNEKSKKAVIRAGDHHEHDIYHYKDEIINFFNKNEDWELCVIGSNPVFLSEEIENYTYIGDLDIRSYFACIKQIKPSLFIVPLIDNKFNRGKSNISWIEATYAGAVTLAPVWLNVHKGCFFGYNNKVDFSNNLGLINNTQSKIIKEVHSNSVNEVIDKYLLSKNNDYRLDLIKSVL